MRTSLWPGLVQALMHNLNRQQKRVRIFECGSKYIKQGNEIKEYSVISGAVTGALYPEQWGMPSRAADYYDVKGDVEALLSSAHVLGELRFTRRALHPALHPGQSASLVDERGAVQGWLGVLHPQLAHELQLEQNVLVFEVSFNIIAGGGMPVFRALSKFPAVRRDMAVIVAEAVSAQDLLDMVREAAGERLQELQLFDVYRGKGIDSGKKSIALGLTFQDFSRTLTDSEIDALMERILAHLQDKLGATLRE